MATASDDPHLGAGPSDDSEILLDDSDSGSVLSDDSVLPDYERADGHAEPAKTLYEACARNDPTSLCRIMARGVTEEEAMELDINGRVRCISLVVQDEDSEPMMTPFICPLSPSERTHAGRGQGFCGHRHPAAHVSTDRHKPPGQ